MAPEVFTQSGYTVAADIWSFGMVLYEMLTLKQPYYHVQPIQVASQIMQGVLPIFPDLGSTYAPLIELIKNKMMTLTPESRATADILVTDFAKLL